MRNRMCILVLVFLLSPALLRAAPLPLSQLQHKSWTAVDSAPSHALDLVQGPDGLLWISAVDGLYRFDGTRFTSFRLPKGLAPTQNNAYSLRVTRAGDLWAGSYYQGFIRISHDGIQAFGAKEGLPNAPIVSLGEAPDGRMWCIADGRLLRFTGEQWSDEGSGVNLPVGDVDTLLFDHAGVLWVATKSGRLYFRAPGQKLFQLSAETWANGLNIQSFLESPNGSLWIALQDPKGGSSVVRELNVPGHLASAPLQLQFPYNVWQVLFDRSGAMWLTGQGVRRIVFGPGGAPDNSNRPSRILRNELVDDGLSSSATHFLCEDNDGDIWVTTLRGVERFRIPALVSISPAATDLALAPDLAEGSHGRVWLRAGGTRIAAFEGGQIVAEGPDAITCFALFEDHTGALWYSDGKELWRFQGGQSSKVPLPEGVSVRRLMQISELPQGPMLLLFADLGLWQWTANHWERAYLPAQSQAQITAMLVEPTGTLWFGYASGQVATWDGPTASFRVIGDSSLGTVYAFLRTPFGMFASGNSGIAALQGDSFRAVTIRSEAEVAGVSGMIQALDGDLWLNADHGIFHIAKAELNRGLKTSPPRPVTAEMFTEPNIRGPARRLSDLPTVARDATGRLWFNTSDTIAFIDASHIARNTVAPVLRISSLSSDSDALEQPYRIAPGHHTIRIDYFGSNLTAPEKVRYRYKLLGVDNDWQDVGARTEAVYTQLGPKNYSFQVMATNGESAWSEPVGVTFMVRPMFYQTVWFMVLCCCVGLGLAVFAYSVRIGAITKSLRTRAEERASERIRIARDLHDTLLQGIQALMLSFHVAAQALPKDTPARRMLDGALLKADRLVIEGRDRVTRLRSESLEGVSLPEALRALGTELDPHHVVEFDVQISQAEMELQPQVKDELFCIAREAITNSYRHAEARQIGVSLDYDRHVLSMVCHDDGRGIEAESSAGPEAAKHFGMLGMQERARRLSASFQVDSDPGHGTKITVRIQAGRVYLRSSKISFWPQWMRGRSRVESQ
jgi:ligand-binding sensor domain-containing protein/anti-sigma regulatory factor (Ser/Thr protein kinase)